MSKADQLKREYFGCKIVSVPLEVPETGEEPLTDGWRHTVYQDGKLIGHAGTLATAILKAKEAAAAVKKLPKEPPKTGDDE